MSCKKKCTFALILMCFCLKFGIANDDVKENATVLDSDRDWSVIKVDTFFPPELTLLAQTIDQLPAGNCHADATHFINGVFKRELWAMQMLDASPKFPVGMRYGETYQMGNFDECIAIDFHKKYRNTSVDIRGKYCMAEIFALSRNANGKINEVFRGTFSNTLHWAICVPSRCSPNDVSTFFDGLFAILFPGNSVNVTVSGLSCHFEEALELTNAELVYGSVLLVYILFITLATAYHLVSLYYREKTSIYSLESTPRNSGTLHKVIIAFSIVRNVSKILQVKQKNDLNLNCVSGMKFLFMSLIIPGHTLLFSISGPIMNSAFYEQARTQVQNAIFFNNPLLVDTFLFLSGFLMCRILIEELDKRKGKINILVIYIGRYIRLTPSYIVIIGLYCTFLTRLDNGPLWNSVIWKEKERCLNSWWANILYINNYLNTDHLCMFQSWFLAVDTHMFIISAFIIFFLWRFKNFGKIFLAVFTILTLVAHGIETYVKKVDPTLMIYPSEVVDLNSNSYFTNIYIKTHIRASSYCVGLICGYVVYKLYKSSSKIPSYIKLSGWLLALLTGVASMFSISIFYQPGYQYNLTESIFYSTFNSVAWCGFIAWILIICVTGNGGIINKFLSLKVFVPLSRLTYCAYLVNGVIELHSRGTLRNPLYMSVFSLAKLSLSHLVLTFIAAFILCVLFESPIHSLEKILLCSRDKPKPNIRSSNNNETPVFLKRVLLNVYEKGKIVKCTLTQKPVQ